MCQELVYTYLVLYTDTDSRSQLVFYLLFLFIVGAYDSARENAETI